MAPSVVSTARSRLQRAFAGLSLKGLGLIVLICFINAVRRTIQNNGPDALGHGALAYWLTHTLDMTGWALIIALPVALSVVAAYNLAPPRPRVRYTVVGLALVAAATLCIAAAVYVEYVFWCPPDDECHAAGWTRDLVSAWVRYGLLCALFTVVFVYL